MAYHLASLLCKSISSRHGAFAPSSRGIAHNVILGNRGCMKQKQEKGTIDWF